MRPSVLTSSSRPRSASRRPSLRRRGRRLHGVVADESGGVLPGVTVVATSQDGRVLATAVTDEVGRYAFRPAGRSGQAHVSARRLLGLGRRLSRSPADADARFRRSGSSSRRNRRRSWSAARSALQRSAAATAPRMPPPPPPPRVLKPVPDHDQDSVCGPAKPAGATDAFGTIRSRPHGRGQRAVRGGRRGEDRRAATRAASRSDRTSSRGARIAPAPDPDGCAGEHTAGLMQIVAVDEQAAAAVVIYACDEVMRGDWLAPFTPEPVRAPEPAGTPAYDRAARILLTDAGQLIGAPRRLMVIDRGSDNGIRVGQRLTLFRPARPRRAASVGDRRCGRRCGPRRFGDDPRAARHRHHRARRLRRAAAALSLDR